jgi:hypothetical protein
MQQQDGTREAVASLNSLTSPHSSKLCASTRGRGGTLNEEIVSPCIERGEAEKIKAEAALSAVQSTMVLCNNSQHQRRGSSGKQKRSWGSGSGTQKADFLSGLKTLMTNDLLLTRECSPQNSEELPATMERSQTLSATELPPPPQQQQQHSTAAPSTALSPTPQPTPHESEFVPQHQYGEDGCDWMDAYVHCAPRRDLPTDPSPPVAAGVTLLLLSSENLRVHEHAAALAHSRAKAGKNAPSPLHHPFHTPPEAVQSKGKAAAAAAAVDPAAAAAAAAARSRSITCVVGVILAVVWCIQLLLSLDATASGVSQSPIWALNYAAAVCGIVACISQLVHAARGAARRKRLLQLQQQPKPTAAVTGADCSVDEARQAVDTQEEQQAAATVAINSYAQQQRTVSELMHAIQLEALQVACAGVCIFMHGVMVLHCNIGSRVSAADWFMQQEAADALCEASSGALLPPLLALDLLIAVIALLRCAFLVCERSRAVAAAAVSASRHSSSKQQQQQKQKQSKAAATAPRAVAPGSTRSPLPVR